MDRSGNWRYYQRSKSCNSHFENYYDTNKALSRAIWGKRFDELTQIPPRLDVEREILQSQLADIHYKLLARELVKNNSYTRNDKSLMQEARKLFPKQFPKESQDVLAHAKDLFRQDWRCIFWDLLIPAYKFSKEVNFFWIFGDLMKRAARMFPGEFTREKFEDLMEAMRRNAVFRRTFQVVMNELPYRNLYPLMKLGRDVFHNEFPHEKFEDLMTYAQRLFPEEFPQECFTDSYKAMVAILVNRSSLLKDEKLLAINNEKLDCLRDVATKFCWSNNNEQLTDKDFGKQFFVLCKYVAELNRDLCHPELKGQRMEEFLERARKGLFKIDGVDVGHAIELLYRSRTS